MTDKIKAAFISAAILVIPVACENGNAQDRKIILHYFFGRECHHCKKLEPKLSSLVRQNSHIILRSYEVWYNPHNRRLLLSMAGKGGKTVRGVPVVIIGSDVYVGSDIRIIRALVLKKTGIP